MIEEFLTPIKNEDLIGLSMLPKQIIGKNISIYKEDEDFPVDGAQKNIGVATVLIAKDGKWQHRNGDNNLTRLFGESNGNISGGRTKLVSPIARITS